ncbi:restriction endonuclease subunit S [Kluyvera sp. M-M157-B]|uniref:restriction endonuclease subunit S n=1 Tax=Kluyvera sp. M-M157-B TaxID=3402291 RepID=UPI003B253432
MMSLWDALRMNMMISYQELVRTFPRTEQFQKHTNSHSTGTTVLHLSKNSVPGYRFILANEGLVNIYAQYAKSIFSKVNTTIEENNCLSELRDTLLPKLLSGEITLPEAEQAVSEAENV